MPINVQGELEASLHQDKNALSLPPLPPSRVALRLYCLPLERAPAPASKSSKSENLFSTAIDRGVSACCQPMPATSRPRVSAQQRAAQVATHLVHGTQRGSGGGQQRSCSKRVLEGGVVQRRVSPLPTQSSEQQQQRAAVAVYLARGVHIGSCAYQQLSSPDNVLAGSQVERDPPSLPAQANSRTSSSEPTCIWKLTVDVASRAAPAAIRTSTTPTQLKAAAQCRGLHPS